jgi:hypothetical protein
MALFVLNTKENSALCFVPPQIRLTHLSEGQIMICAFCLQSVLSLCGHSFFALLCFVSSLSCPLRLWWCAPCKVACRRRHPLIEWRLTEMHLESCTETFRGRVSCSLYSWVIVVTSLQKWPGFDSRQDHWIFSSLSRPVPLWGPPSLLTNGNWCLFPGDGTVGSVKLTT